MKDLGEIFNRHITSSIVSDLGYGEMLDFCDEQFGKEDFDLISSMLIGYKRINQRFPGTIYLDSNVKEYINSVVKPYTDKGLEVPFFLLGIQDTSSDNMSLYIDKVMAFYDGSALKNNEAVMTTDALQKVENEMDNGKYNVAIMGHSHPAITSDEVDSDQRYEILYNQLRSLKNELDLRGNNLDITVMDIRSLIIFENEIGSFQKDSTVMSCIYHNDGELNFIHYDGKWDLSLATDVYYKANNGFLEPVDNFDTNDIRKVR